MNHENTSNLEVVEYDTLTAAAPSADYIHRISEFFDTDPNDLLEELGYYDRSETARPALAGRHRHED